MRRPVLAAMAAAFLLMSNGANADQPMGESAEAGSALAGQGASVVLEGSAAAAEGNVIGGSVAMPLGAASVAAGSASAATGTVAQAAVAPLDAVFGTEPLPLTAATVVAQPAPNVPHAPPPAEPGQ